jgi:glutamine amidotransferase-like uncharacterized protein
MSLSIFIYNDYGSSEKAVDEMKDCLVKICHSLITKIEMISANEIIKGKLNSVNITDENKCLFCLGGGFDLGYLKSLSYIGCSKIREFVENGGFYLGICAGAYFATNSIEFDLNGPLEVKGERLLKLFNVTAHGPINKNFKYNSEEEAISIKVDLNNYDNNLLFYLNGGCYFMADDDRNSTFECIGTFNDERFEESFNKMAIIESQVGKGKCLISGFHFEFNSNNSNNSNSKQHSNEAFIRYLFNKVFDI